MGNKQVDSSQNSKQGKQAGGRSEQQAQQRNQEQAKAGHDKSAEVPRDGVQNVKSEPHWDPADKPEEPEA